MKKINTTCVNDQIRAKQVRLIDENENQIGVVDIGVARNMASTANLDLIEIAAKASPPVVKIGDYGKFKYEMSKRDKEAKKKQRAAQIDTKELRYRPTTGEHDLEIMLKQAEKFLDRGDRVKFCIRAKGREAYRLKDAIEPMKEMIKPLNVKYVTHPQLSGRQITCVVEKSND